MRPLTSSAVLQMDLDQLPTALGAMVRLFKVLDGLLVPLWGVLAGNQRPRWAVIE